MEQAIELFIRFLAVERGLSQNYQLSTQRSLTEFAQWCATRKKTDDPRKVTLALLSEYLADRKRGGLSASSIKLIVVALKIFFRFLAGKGVVDADPSEALSLPRIERYLPETLNEIQVEQLIEAVDTKVPLGLRDRAMIELLYASGLRISELANARLENFVTEEGILRVTGKGNNGGTSGSNGTRIASMSVDKDAEKARLAQFTSAEPFVAKHYMYPIPVDQIQISSVGGQNTLTQNPGW